MTPAINDPLVSDVILGSGLRSVIASDAIINFTLALVIGVGLDDGSEVSLYNLVSLLKLLTGLLSFICQFVF